MADDNLVSSKKAGGAFADGLTLIRILLTPLIMALIILHWPDTQMAIFISILFIIAAVTDIFDDYFGGAARSVYRKYGWADDIADTVLVLGTLIALSIVLWREGLFVWPFAVPAVILIIREIFVGLFKGFEILRYGSADTKLSNFKAGFSMLAVCLLVASPWLTQYVDVLRAGSEDSVAVYDAASPYIWWIGQAALWIAALFSVIAAIELFKKPLKANDA